MSGALCILDLTTEAELERAEQVHEAWPAVRYAIGVHPHHAGTVSGPVDEIGPRLETQLSRHPDVRAIGEIGLDYHYDFAPRERQQDVFRYQVRFARDHDLPVVIHTREADEDTVAILESEGQGHVRGVFHCFTGSPELARRVLDLGFHVSFSGIVTFRRAENVREAARLVPPDRLLVETDAPYLAPVPHRGSRNEPAWVARVVDVLAEVRSEPADVVAESTTASFEFLFGSGEQPAKGLLR